MKRTGLIIMSVSGAFITLTGPDNVSIGVAVEHIVSVREPRGQDRVVHKDAQCILFLADGKFIAVEEKCETVRALIDDAKGEQ